MVTLLAGFKSYVHQTKWAQSTWLRGRSHQTALENDRSMKVLGTGCDHRAVWHHPSFEALPICMTFLWMAERNTRENQRQQQVYTIWFMYIYIYIYTLYICMYTIYKYRIYIYIYHIYIQYIHIYNIYIYTIYIYIYACIQYINIEYR
jgi:hypothetical protein